MIRDDKSKFLLYMEPKLAPIEPIDDLMTRFIQDCFDETIKGAANYSSVGEKEHFTPGSGWRGCHRCACGEVGGNHDYQLKNGMITNDLCVHYISCHRDEICDNDKRKINELIKWYKENGNIICPTNNKSFK